VKAAVVAVASTGMRIAGVGWVALIMSRAWLGGLVAPL
jgi:hypothetical protein